MKIYLVSLVSVVEGEVEQKEKAFGTFEKAEEHFVEKVKADMASTKELAEEREGTFLPVNEEDLKVFPWAAELCHINDERKTDEETDEEEEDWDDEEAEYVFELSKESYCSYKQGYFSEDFVIINIKELEVE